MPVSIQMVRKSLADKFDNDLMKDIISSNDLQLSNAAWLKDNRCGTPESGWYWSFTHRGEVSENEKKHLIEEYRTAGWRCEVTNSGDTERAGIIGIKLSMPPEGVLKR